MHQRGVVDKLTGGGNGNGGPKVKAEAACTVQGQPCAHLFAGAGQMLQGRGAGRTAVAGEQNSHEAVDLGNVCRVPGGNVLAG